MNETSNESRGPLIIITNADVNIKEMAVAQQLRDFGIDFSHIVKKRGSQKAFVFFRTQDNLEQAAALIRLLKSPIALQPYLCEVVTQEVAPAVPATVIDADVKTVNGLLNFSQLNNPVEDPSLTCSFDDLSILGGTDKSILASNFLPSRQSIKYSSAKVVKVVAPYYSDNAEDELLAKSKSIRNAIKGQLAKMYRNHKNSSVLPVWARRNECVTHLRQPVPVYCSHLYTEYRSKVEFTIGWSESIIDTPAKHSSQATGEGSSESSHSATIAIGPCVRIGKKMIIFTSSQLSEACIFPAVTIKLSSLLEQTLTEAHSSGQLSDDELAIFATLAIRCAGDASNLQFDVNQILIGILLRIDLQDNDSSNLSPATEEQPTSYLHLLQKVWTIILKFNDQLNALKHLYHIVPYIQTTLVKKGAPHHVRYYPIMPELMETSSSRFYISQSLFGLSFRIGPTTFFQSNISTFILLLDYISNKIVKILHSSNSINLSNKKDPTPLVVELLDICCGSGVIGQCIAQILLKRLLNHENVYINVRGIDSSQEAIWNSEYNASENFKHSRNVSTFYTCGKVEQSPEYFSGLAKIGILDPPRAGIFQSVIAALRQSTLEYLIYISCNPKTMSQNLIDLFVVQPDIDMSKRTIPFCIESLVGFNMFPGCEHVESVAILRRCLDFEGTPPSSQASPSVSISSVMPAAQSMEKLPL